MKKSLMVCMVCILLMPVLSITVFGEETCNVGDIFVFGAYEQDNDTSNGKEPIEWIILDRNEYSFMLISKYALDCQAFDTKHADNTWGSCSLRRWLNETFINDAFSVDEQMYIQETVVTADKNLNNTNLSQGADTKDKIFLLSQKESEIYFASDFDRICAPTEFASIQGILKRTDPFLPGTYYETPVPGCPWLLRTVETDDGLVSCITCGGMTGSEMPKGAMAALYSQEDDGGIRPALWVSLVEPGISKNEEENDEKSEHNTEICAENEIPNVVKRYFDMLQKYEKSDVIEYYSNIQPQIFSGPEDDTYVVYAVYDYKYREYDSVIPGITEFYLETDSEGNLQIIEMPADEAAEYMNELRQTDTVQRLIQDIQIRYQRVLDQDPELSKFVVGKDEGNNIDSESDKQNIDAADEKAPIKFAGSDHDGEVSLNISETADYDVNAPFDQKYWIIFTEGYRDDRVEASTFDSDLPEEELNIVWDTGLDINTTSISGDCDQYYLDNDGEWIYIGSYHRLSDYATNVLYSNLNVVNTDGDVIISKTPYSEIDWDKVDCFR